MSDPMTPAVPDPTVEAQLADVLSDHRTHDLVPDGTASCDCDGTLYEVPDYYRHVAAVLAPILAEHTERAVREALEAAAEELLPMTHASAHREVCANEYRSDRTAAHVALDVAADWLRTRARIVREGGRP